MISFHSSTGLTEVAPASLIENSFISSNIRYDTALPSIVKRKGYPDIGMIFITTISESPILTDWGIRDLKRVSFTVDGNHTRPRLSLLNYGDADNNRTFETFVILFTRVDLEQIASSKEAYFQIGATNFVINDALKAQIKEIL